MARALDCYVGPTVQGIDVSYAQGVIDWDAVKASGLVDFAIIRTGDGYGTDRQFERNWREAKRVGIRRGAYHYLRMFKDGAQQANISANMVGEAGGLGYRDLPPTVDIEGLGNTNAEASPERIVEVASAFIDKIESRLRRKPIIYTGGYWATKFAGRPDLAARFNDHALWRPAWSVDCPPLLPGWSGWTFWQWSNVGAIPGIAGNVDLDVFRGSEWDLGRFVARSKITPWWLWGAAAVAAAGAGYYVYNARLR